MRKLGVSFVITMIYFFIFTVYSSACVGARPMAMGGAFIAVADDASATYWNPAGLDQEASEREKAMEDTLADLTGIEVTYTPTVYERDEYNYDDFFAITTPLKFRDYDLGALAFSFINNIDVPWEVDGAELKITERWYWVSYAKNIFKGLSAGINLRHQTYNQEFILKEGWGMDLDGDGILDIIGPRSFANKDDTFALDLSFFYKFKWLSLGLLVQDLNEPELLGTEYIRNVRPGIALRPDDDTVIALDMYDATGETENAANSVAQDIRLGLERWFNLPGATPPWLGERLAVRVGGYHINNSDMRAYTFGFGLKGTDWDQEQPWFKSGELDYACLYWDDSGEFTHQIGLTFGF